MDIFEYIKELIIKDQDVILPGFGGFISEYESAIFDVTENKFLPPTKNIQFKPEYSFPDNTLVNLIAKRASISKTEASKILENFLSDLRIRLNKEKQIDIIDIGFLKKTEKGIIEFVQNKEINLLSDAYGLKSFTSNPLADKSEKNTDSIKKRPNWKKVGIYSFLLILIFGITGTAWYLSDGFTDFEFISINHEEINTENATDAYFNKSVIYLDSIAKSDSIKANINNSIDVSTIKKDALFYTEHKSIIEEPKTQYSNFYIIAGSFKDSINAQKFCIELIRKGFTPTIIESDKTIYRVALNSYKNETKALTELYSLRSNSEIKQVWILKSN